MKNKKNLPDNRPTSTSYKAPTPKVEEEIYNLQEDNSLIQYEMNMIELPFFSRDKNVGEAVIKKYIFSGNQYMEVIPSSDKSSGYKIPQEFDEKIFYAIMQLHRKQGKRKIITTIYELLKLAGYGDRKEEYERVKQSLDRLSGTEYVFSGIMYDKKNNRRIKERVKNSILQRYGIREIDDLSEEEKAAFGREKANKSVVVLEISNFIEENIEHKGFLYYDAEKLLDVRNSTARKLYLLISKWQGWEKQPSIKRSCRFLASRIPLSWESTNIPGTINALEKAAKELIERQMIGSYHLERKKPLALSEMVFYFEGANETARVKEIMRANIELSTETGHEGMIIDAVHDEFLDDRQSSLFDVPGFNKTDEIFNLLPEKYQTENNRKILSHYSGTATDYIRSNIEYTLKNCTDNFGAYLNRSLKEDWGSVLREKEEQAKKEIELERKRKEEEETKRREEDLSVDRAIENMSKEEYSSYGEKAKESTYYRRVLEEKVRSGDMKEEDAVLDAIKIVFYDKLLKGKTSL